MKRSSVKTRQPVTRIGRRGAKGAEALRNRRRLKEAALLVSLTVVISLFYVWSRVAVVQTGYRIHHLTNEYQEFEDQYRALKLELATRTSPERLGPLARTRFNLRPPKPGQVIIVPQQIRIAEQNHVGAKQDRNP